MTEHPASEASSREILLRCAGLERVVHRTSILGPVDLEVRAGELIIVSGPSGAGKTSLLRLIAGLDQPSAGTIDLQGRQVSSPTRMVPPIERQVGMVFEHAALWPHLSVERHLELVLRPSRLDRGARRTRIDRLLESLRLTALRRRYPHELSGGERQRVALARSLAPSPRLLLLDEPLAHLDVHLAADLAGILIEMHREQNLTMICVMHRPEKVNAVASRYVILEGGEISDVGSGPEVFGTPKTEFIRALASLIGV